MNTASVFVVFANDSNREFFFYISMLDSEYNKIGKKIDYSCKSHIFRRILILLVNMLNSFDVC